MPDHLSPEVLELLGGAVAVVGAFAALVFGFRRARRAGPPPFKKLKLPPPRGPARVEPPAETVAAPLPVPVAPRPPAKPAPEPAAAPAPAPPRRADWRAGLSRSRAGLVGKLEGIFRGRAALDDAALAEVETVLFGADLGVRTADDFLERVRRVRSPDEVRPALEARAREILGALPSAVVPVAEKPHVILVVGVNGSGKTTTIGKLAARYAREGKRVVVAAGDTYRAAAIDQLAIWADRAGVEIVKGAPGGDPAAVAFDAVKSARTRGLDVVLVDTAGRLQTDQGLMDELAKIQRVMRKEMASAPHEVLLVLDANTGQNAIRQAQEFKKAVAVTGIALTKLDGTARGGVVLGVAQEVGLPVRYAGLGESLDDLADFDAAEFATALFAPD
ncbi:MAG TPA: signal recognition particle-docking protein FtsY [Myxococcota bacterium]|nr:signal recognition particle-docking protein FtsY [Myxococcota bacterium]